MADDTEAIRRHMQAEINGRKAGRKMLEMEHGQVWTTDELALEFEVIGFAAPLCVVRRRSDGQKGSVYFQHEPRLYFSFQPD